jgi:hypothetical protein
MGSTVDQEVLDQFRKFLQNPPRAEKKIETDLKSVSKNWVRVRLESRPLV